MTAPIDSGATRLATALFWVSRLIAAFLGVAAILIAGYAPYTGNMWAVLGIAGLLLLAAALAWFLGAVIHHLAKPVP